MAPGWATVVMMARKVLAMATAPKVLAIYGDGTAAPGPYTTWWMVMMTPTAGIMMMRRVMMTMRWMCSHCNQMGPQSAPVVERTDFGQARHYCKLSSVFIATNIQFQSEGAPWVSGEPHTYLQAPRSANSPFACRPRSSEVFQVTLSDMCLRRSTCHARKYQHAINAKKSQIWGPGNTKRAKTPRGRVSTWVSVWNQPLMCETNLWYYLCVSYVIGLEMFGAWRVHLKIKNKLQKKRCDGCGWWNFTPSRTLWASQPQLSDFPACNGFPTIVLATHTMATL